MFNFLMVSTVFSKKQFTVISIKRDELTKFAQELIKGRNNLILYPLITVKNVNDVADLLDERICNSLIAEIKTENPSNRTLNVRNFNRSTFKGVLSIEHVFNDLFRIRCNEITFMSNSFEFFM